MTTQNTITQTIKDTYFTSAEQGLINNYVPSLSDKGGFDLLSHLADMYYNIANFTSGELTPIAGAGLGVSGSALVVNVDNSTLEVNTDTVRVKDAGVTPAKQSTAARTRVAILPFRLVAPTGAPQGPFTKAVFKCTQALTIVSVGIASDTASTGSDATNNYNFLPRNLTGAANLHTSATTTQGAELSTTDLKAITVSQNLAFTANQVFGITVNIADDGSAGPTNLSSAQLYAVVEYTI